MDHTWRLMDTAAAAYRRFAQLAEHADPDLPTRLAAWRVRDLIDHVAWGAAMEAAAMRAATDLAPEPAPGDLPGAVAAFERAARLRPDRQAPVVVPAGTMTVEFAAALFCFEAAIHDADLAQALTGRQRDLSADELTACELVVGPMLDLAGASVPDDGVVVDLIGLGAGIRLAAVRGA